MHFPAFGIKGLSEGVHQLEAKAYTSAGVVDPTPVCRKFIIDMTAPVTTITAPGASSQGATATLRRLIQLGGCPPGCMLARFSWSLAAAAADEQQAAGVLSARGLCSMWRRFVGELRRRWESNDSLWAVRGWSQSAEAEIEMGSLMLHQQLQLLEACMRWRAAAGVLHRGA